MGKNIFEIKNLRKRFPARGLPTWLRQSLCRMGFLVREERNQLDRYYRLEIDELEIPSGIVALQGPSGSGKSTLLNILAALDTGYTGNVTLVRRGGRKTLPRSVTDADAFRRDHFSFVFQSSNLLSNLKVARNATLSRAIAGQADLGCVDLLDRFFEQQGAIIGDRYPSELSGGQRQRVALCRALTKARDGAQVLFADEPTASLDRAAADNCFELLEEWVRDGPDRLLLLATHDLAQARKADHFIEIGPVESDDPPSKCASTSGESGTRSARHGVRFQGDRDEYLQRQEKESARQPAEGDRDAQGRSV